MARPKLTHLDARGAARMVDVGAKDATERVAVARASVRMERATRELLERGETKKGDALAVARIAGIQAAKRTPELIPLCHAIALTSVEVAFDLDADGARVHVLATAKARDRTVVEMEALVAATTAALTLYDMLKAVDRALTIEHVELVEKRGGKSGDFARGETTARSVSAGDETSAPTPPARGRGRRSRG